MVLPAPPLGTNWVDTITTDLTMVLMITMFSSFCVPMLCALYFFSARKGCQKSLVFHLNAGVLCLGIFQGAYCVGVVVCRSYSSFSWHNDLIASFVDSKSNPSCERVTARFISSLSSLRHRAEACRSRMDHILLCAVILHPNPCRISSHFPAGRNLR